MTYAERIKLVRQLFSDLPVIKDNPPTPRHTPGNLGMSSTPEKRQSSSLPLNPAATELFSDMTKIITGKDSKYKSADAGGLSTGTYVKRPDFRDKTYRVTRQPHFHHAAVVPLDFRALQPAASSTKKPGLSLSASETTDVEMQLKRIGMTLSYQDWFLGGAKLLLYISTYSVTG